MIPELTHYFDFRILDSNEESWVFIFVVYAAMDLAGESHVTKSLPDNFSFALQFSIDVVAN